MLQWSVRIGSLVKHFYLPVCPRFAAILWVDVAQLHLEVARPLVAHIREVRLSVVKEQCILRALVQLELWHHTRSIVGLELNDCRRPQSNP